MSPQRTPTPRILQETVGFVTGVYKASNIQTVYLSGNASASSAQASVQQVAFNAIFTPYSAGGTPGTALPLSATFKNSTAPFGVNGVYQQTLTLNDTRSTGGYASVVSAGPATVSQIPTWALPQLENYVPDITNTTGTVALAVGGVQSGATGTLGAIDGTVAFSAYDTTSCVYAIVFAFVKNVNE